MMMDTVEKGDNKWKKENLLLSSSHIAISDASFPHLMWLFSHFSRNIVTTDIGCELPKDGNHQHMAG